MAKKPTKKPRKLAKLDRFPLIDRELRKRTKADLIAMTRSFRLSSPPAAARWAGAMQQTDRVGFICDKELARLPR